MLYRISFDPALTCCQRNTVYMLHEIAELSHRYVCLSCSKYRGGMRMNVFLLTVLKVLSLILGSYKHSGCCVLLSGVFQHQGTAIQTLRNVGVTRNCVVQDRLIFVMYKAENSYKKLKADHRGYLLLQAKK
jgi:hypothetical protein